ncbi:MAG: TraR/DksA family transcriptional regulator [Actinomycetes bacterium]
MAASAKTLQSIRASLEDEERSLRARLNELGFGVDKDEGPEYDPNFADSSQVSAERGENEVLANSLRETLNEVQHALAKFDGGTYGSCERCGQPIAPARLEAKPEARLCITDAAAAKANGR